MTRVLDIVEYVRSKNAGPFCLTVDIFCGSRQAFFQICKHLETTHIAKVFEINFNCFSEFLTILYNSYMYMYLYMYLYMFVDKSICFSFGCTFKYIYGHICVNYEHKLRA